MTVNNNEKYEHYTKMAWIIYSISAVVIATVLVFFVARDNEEMFFYGFMTIAGAYVLRPSERMMDRQILKFTGVSKPTEEE